jgi:lysophospholipase L1-like esterase
VGDRGLVRPELHRQRGRNTFHEINLSRPVNRRSIICGTLSGVSLPFPWDVPKNPVAYPNWQIADRADIDQGFLTVPKGWTERWQARLDQARTRLVRIAILGDSTSAGLYENDVNLTYAGRMNTALQGAYGDGGIGLATSPNRSIGGFGGPGDPAGQRAVTTGALTTVAGGPGWLGFRPTVLGNGATITFHAVRGTAIDLITRRGSGFGSLSVSVDGDTPTAHSQANATGDIFTETVRSGLSSGPHTVTITFTTGDARFWAIRGRNAAGIIVDNLSAGGTNWAAGTGTSQSSTAADGVASATNLSTNLGVMTPADLLILALGVNDAPGTTATRDNIEAQLGEAYKRSRTMGLTPADPPLLLVMGMHYGNHDNKVAGHDAAWIASTIRGFATAVGAAYVDVWGLGRYSFEYWASLTPSRFAIGGLDTIHPSYEGHADIFELMRPLLLPTRF